MRFGITALTMAVLAGTADDGAHVAPDAGTSGSDAMGSGSGSGSGQPPGTPNSEVLCGDGQDDDDDELIDCADDDCGGFACVAVPDVRFTFAVDLTRDSAVVGAVSDRIRSTSRRLRR